MQRATVLNGPGKMEPGFVCASCARNGWLLVLGADAPDTATTVARKAKRARSVGALMSHVLGSTVALLVALGCDGSGSSLDASDVDGARDDGGSVVVGLIDAHTRDARTEHDAAAELDAGELDARTEHDAAAEPDAGEPACEGDALRFCGAANCERACIYGSNRVCCETEPEGAQSCACEQ